MPKILYAEDDATLALLTVDNLEEAGYRVTHCPDGQICIDAFHNGRFDLCILDIMMPKKDGFEVATEIRQSDPDIPLLFLSAKTLEEDRIKGLRMGADDYLVKPFSMEELLLKIEVFLRRSRRETQPAYTQLGPYRFDAENNELCSDSTKIKMTQRESELLAFFSKNRNKVVKREDILKTIWGNDDYFMGRSLDVFISRLRKLLPREGGIFIENIHGVGFRLVVPES